MKFDAPVGGSSPTPVHANSSRSPPGSTSHCGWAVPASSLRIAANSSSPVWFSCRHDPVSHAGDIIRAVLSEYLRAAMRRATFEVIEDDGSFYGRIPALEGVWANASNLEDCRAELEQVLEEWLLLRLSERISIPEIDGIDLTVRQEVA